MGEVVSDACSIVELKSLVAGADNASIWESIVHSKFGRKSKIYLTMGMLTLVAAILVSCAGGLPESTRERVLHVGMLLAEGGLGDRSFNDSAYAGLQEAQRLHTIRFETADYTSDDANQERLRDFAREGYDLIIGVGFENAGYIQTVAAEYPEIPFAIIDGTAEGDNVASIVYREQEGDFLGSLVSRAMLESLEALRQKIEASEIVVQERMTD